MPRHRRGVSQDENLDRWLLTYADLITLLLAFFVVMYSMSQVDAKRFGRMVEALSGVLKGGTSVLQNAEQPEQPQGHGLLKLGDLAMIQHQIDEKFQNLGRDHGIETEITERGLVIHIMESTLFDEGSAELKPGALETLDLVYTEIKDRPNHIRVEGHTDNRPIATPQFPSNWELSTARATSVVRYFTDYHGTPRDKVSALGYGEFRPVASNGVPEGRARNRRVDIVLLTMELSLKEPTSQLYEGER